MAVSLTMLVVFFSGYYVGHHKAESGGGMHLNKTIALALPGPAHADTTEYEPRIPQRQIPGAFIDVDSPDETAAGINDNEQATTQTQIADAEVQAVINETTSIIENSTASEVSTMQDNQQLHLASLEITPEVFKTGNVSTATNQIDNQSIIAGDHQQSSGSIESDSQAVSMDTAAPDDARYTIQVGVFADAENAMRKKSDLESHKLSAYIDEYTNKREQLRYNVRFGYFKDKSSAVAALNRFEQHDSGSGYVTRIRQD